MITIALVLAISIIANLYTWCRTLQALVFSQRKHLQRSITNLEILKSEGFIQALRSEVTLMTDMVNYLFFSFSILITIDEHGFQSLLFEPGQVHGQFHGSTK